MIYDQHVAIVAVLLRPDEMQSIVGERFFKPLLVIEFLGSLPTKSRRRTSNFIVHHYFTQHEESYSINKSPNHTCTSFTSMFHSILMIHSH